MQLARVDIATLPAAAQMPLPAVPAYPLKVGALALAYLVAATVGLEFARENASVTAVWAPSGIALAALVLWGRSLWPGIAIGALLANALTAAPLAAAPAIAAGNTLEALIGATLLLRLGDFEPSLGRARDVVALATLAAGISTMVAATVGVASLYASGAVAADGVLSAWRTWWLGDAVGILMIAPLLMVFAAPLRAIKRRQRLLEATALGVALVGVTWYVFTSAAPRTFMIFPVLVWAALRFGPRGVTVGSLIVSGIAVGLTVNGSGPFAGTAPEAGLLDTQVFVGVSAVAGLLLAAVLSERGRAQEALRTAHDGLEAEVHARTLELAQSEAALAESQEISELGFWTWDIEADRVTWSDQLYRIFGVSPDDFEPSFGGYLERVHPDDRASVEATIRTALEHGEPFAHDERIVRPDGSARWLATKGKVFIEGGKAVRMRGVCQDRTDREQAAEALRQAETRARRVIEDAHDAFVAIDASGRIIDWNPRAEQTFGWQRSEALGRPLAETIIPERYRDAHRRGLERFLATGEGKVLGTRLELEALHRDGHEFPVELSISAVPTPEGCVFNALLHDISARKRAERTLEEAEARFRATFEGAPTGMALITVDGRFLRVNPALSELTGHPREQLEGADLELVAHPDEVPGLQRELGLIAAGEPRPDTEPDRRLVTASGQTIWAIFRATALDAQHGAPARFIVQIIDISERRHAHAELQRLADSDPLTGLANRRTFERELQAHLERGRRYGMDGAVLVVDLDNLKRVNDSLGHGAGDKLIVGVARALRGRVRDADVLARLGGDEFAILMHGIDVAGAQRVGAELAAAVRRQEVPTFDGSAASISASVGVAMIDDERLTGEEVLDNADRAMYAAKRSGRDRVELHQGAAAPLA